MLFFVLLTVSSVSSLPVDVEEGCHVEMVEKCYNVPGVDCGEGIKLLGRSLESEYRVKREEQNALCRFQGTCSLAESRVKRQEEDCVKKVVRNCIVMEEKCHDLPHMECEGEGEDKAVSYTHLTLPTNREV